VTRTLSLGDQSATSGEAKSSPSPARLHPTLASWRTHLIVAALAIAGSSVILVFAMNPAFNKVNDFYKEAWPSYNALAHGHVLEFLRLGPAYIGSLVLRAPFALIPTAWHGSKAAMYFASAVPCVLAAGAFCAWLAAQPRRRRASWVGRIALVLWCVFNPAVLVAWTGGHPEEVLGAVLCVGGIVLAVKGRVGWAGLLIGLAVVNKPWAVVAVPAALAVMPTERRRGLLVIAVTAGALLIPITLLRTHGGLSASAAGAQLGSVTGTIFNPPQLLWWLGPHSWIVGEARPLIALITLACAVLWWAQRTRARPATDEVADALLLLTFVLLLRAALDPWDNIYYHIPFLFALMAWEVRRGRMPLLAVAYAIAFGVVVPVKGYPYMSPDAHAAVYAAMIVPTIVWLAAKLYLPAGTWRRIVPTSRFRSITPVAEH
jgi:hypothetical protein